MTLPAFNTIYTHYADEVARLATSITIENDVSPSLSGGDDYAPETLVDDNPAKVAKIEDTSGAWIFAYAAKQPIIIAGLIHHTFDETVASPGSPAPSVRLEGNSTNVWTNPTFVGEFPIPPWFGVGTRRWPQNPWLDLSEVSGYDPTGFLFWRLVIENNSQNLQLGQVIFSSVKRQFDPDLQWGLSDTARKPLIEVRTAFEVSTIYSRATTIWQRDAGLRATPEMADAHELHWYDVEGRARPWLLIPSGPGATDRCYMVRYTMTDRQVQWNMDIQHDMRLSFQEVGRGLRPGV